MKWFYYGKNQKKFRFVSISEYHRRTMGLISSSERAMKWKSDKLTFGFLLHLPVFHFVNYFNSIILLFSVHHLHFCKWLLQKDHFKICLFWVLREKECSIYSYLFYSSTVIWLPFEIPFQLLLELEVNLVQGVLVLCEYHYWEFRYCGFSKLYMKFS